MNEIDREVVRLVEATWDGREEAKAALLKVAMEHPDAAAVSARLEEVKRTIDSLEVRWELDEVIEALQATPGGIAWGIYTLAAAVKFLNMDCNIIHGQVCMPSLFVDRGMDWKLGGFELLTEANGADEAAAAAPASVT